MILLWTRFPSWIFHRWFEIWLSHWVFTIPLSEVNSANDMAEVNIPILAIIFRCGWETKILHTIFRYIFTYISNDIRCGNTLAHWFYKVSSDIYGDFPPTLDDIWTESQMVHLFVNSHVFTTMVSGFKKLKHVLSAYVIQFYDTFIGIIVN